jgi:uncharacterized membrane protein YgcG
MVATKGDAVMSKRTFVRALPAASLAAILLGTLLCSTVGAKSYRITRADINARLDEDGSMEVSESLTYRFAGSFTFAYRDLPATGPAAYSDFEVLEAGRPYRQSGTEEPGTFNISRTPERTRVTWFYRAHDQSRTFEFRYRARNAVIRHEDAAVLYFKFVSEEWDIPHENIALSITPPAGVARGEINEWLHGPLWAESVITDEGRILVQCRHLPPHTYLEVRALYPPGAFPDTEPAAGNVRTRITAEEARWAEEANRQREAARQRWAARDRRVRIGRWVMVALGLAGLAGCWWIFSNYRHKPVLPRLPDMASEIPEKIPPALVGYLTAGRQVSGLALVATMLDLGRRGFVALREETVKKRRIWGGAREESEYHWDLDRSHWDERRSDLSDYEDALLEFIFNDLAERGDSISLEAIKKKRRRFVKFFSDWKRSVEEAGKAKHWFDTRSIRGMYYCLALAGSMLALTLVAALLIGAWAMILAPAAVIVMVTSFFIPHRTREGETQAKQWGALKKYLKKYEFRGASRPDFLAQISDYLVYGVVLGLSTKFYEEMAARIPEGEHGVYFPWYVYHGRSAAGFSPASFGTAFSAMVATATSAMSTASGAGGGASAGGGGGASAGGGGAG